MIALEQWAHIPYAHHGPPSRPLPSRCSDSASSGGLCARLCFVLTLRGAICAAAMPIPVASKSESLVGVMQPDADVRGTFREPRKSRLNRQGYLGLFPMRILSPGSVGIAAWPGLSPVPAGRLIVALGRLQFRVMSPGGEGGI